MAITEPYFLYSGESFFAGLNVLSYMSTFSTAGPLAVERTSPFFTAFTFVSVGRLILITLHTHSGALGVLSAAYAIPQALIDCVCSVVFLLAKAAWVKQSCGDTLGYANKSLGVGMRALVGVSNGLAISNCLWHIVVGATTGAYLDHRVMSSAYALYSASLIVSSLVHSTLSATLVYTLVKGQDTAGTKAARAKAKGFLTWGDHHYVFLLAFEVILVVLTHWTRALLPDFDPQNSSVLLADAVRLRIFCLLCERLSARMSKASTITQNGESTTSDQMGTGTSSHGSATK